MAKRTYEISLWTYNDRFISVLVSSESPHIKEAQSTQWNTKINGEVELSFAIPIKIFNQDTNTWYNNEKWYDDLKGRQLLANEQKVKLIFDKFKTAPTGEYIHEIHEFVIEDIQETRTDSELYCQVQCVGAPFKELGKTGTEILLNAETFSLENEESATIQTPTLNYWMDKVLPLSDDTDYVNWSYVVESKIGDEISNKIYENNLIDDWVERNGVLEPVFLTEQPEKARFIDVKNSNKYNIIQDIAETFEVFVDYRYEYNNPIEPFRPTAKVVHFFTELISPTEYSITYGNNMTGLTRTSSSVDITTKMFVEPIESELVDDGFVAISKARNSKNKDDFILNFDYLLSSKIMPGDFIPIIQKFETDLRNKNTTIINLTEESLMISYEINMLKADINVLEKKLQSVENNLRDIDEKVQGISGSDAISGVIAESNNVIGTVKLQNALLTYELKSRGVIESTLGVLHNKIAIPNNKMTFVKDNYGYVIRIIFQADAGVTNGDFVYASYNYDLLAFYRNERATWESIKTSTEETLSHKNELVQLQKAREQQINDNLQAAREEKQLLNKRFTNRLGPFIKEGTWSESSYKPSFVTEVKNSLPIIFDPIPMNSENIAYRMVGQNKEYFHYILLDGISWGPIEQLVIIESFEEQGVDVIRHLKYGAQYLPQFIYRIAVSDILYDNLNQLVQANPSQDYGYQVKDTGKVYSNKSGSWLELLPELALVLDSNVELNQSGHVFIINNSTLPAENLVQGSAFTIAHRRQFLTKSFLPFDSPITDVQGRSIILETQNTILAEFEDYNILQKGWIKNITLKNNNNTISAALIYKLSYQIDVSSEQLYRDAVEVSKTSAYPEVSYTVDFVYLNEALNIRIDEDFNYNKILRLGDIVRITDHELQIQGLKGLVSEIQMNLERPEETKFTIQNYRTKFEDLFTRIVASSEQMKGNSYLYDRVVSAFGPGMQLSPSILQSSFNFNAAPLAIGSSGVIIGDSGILVQSPIVNKNGVKGQTLIGGGEISLSNSINEYGEYIWTTALSPDGINASAITTGVLDTGRVNIYSGDQLRFSWKHDGLFAYRSLNTGEMSLSDYVRFYEEGLFLHRVELTSSGFKQVNRVEVSWDGLILRNKENIKTFFADPDTGNLTLTGAIYANAGDITGDLLVGGSLSTPQFYSGALGLGWRITGDGSAEFNNVYVRGTISASVFEYDKISSIGGSLYIAPTLITMQTAPVSIEGDKYRFTIPHEFSTTGTQTNWSAGREWKLGDVVSLQGYISRFRYDNDQGKILPDPYELKDVRMKLIQFVYDLGIENGATQAIFETVETIDAIDNREETMQWKNESGEQYVYSNPMPEPEDQKDRLEEDAKLIYWGTVDGGNIYRKGIYMTAAHKDSPYIDVYDSNASDLLPKVRLGRLDGLRDAANFPGLTPDQMPDVHGYGLYSENVFLKGTIYATAGRIGSLEIKEVEDSVNATSIQIESLNGLVYNQSGGDSFATTLVARVYRGLREVDDYNRYIFEWQEAITSTGPWQTISGATTRIYNYTASSQKAVRCRVIRST